MEDPKTMEDKPKWELVAETMPSQDLTERLRVEQGWLYRTRVLAGATTEASGQIAVAMVYVPDYR